VLVTILIILAIIVCAVWLIAHIRR